MWFKNTKVMKEPEGMARLVVNFYRVIHLYDDLDDCENQVSRGNFVGMWLMERNSLRIVPVVVDRKPFWWKFN